MKSKKLFFLNKKGYPVWVSSSLTTTSNLKNHIKIASHGQVYQQYLSFFQTKSFPYKCLLYFPYFKNKNSQKNENIILVKK